MTLCRSSELEGYKDPIHTCQCTVNTSIMSERTKGVSTTSKVTLESIEGGERTIAHIAARDVQGVAGISSSCRGSSGSTSRNSGRMAENFRIQAVAILEKALLWMQSHPGQQDLYRRRRVLTDTWVKIDQWRILTDSTRRQGESRCWLECVRAALQVSARPATRREKARQAGKEE